MFHSFFNSLAMSRYSSLVSFSFNFTPWSSVTANSSILQVLYFLLIIIGSGLLAEIIWSVCVSKFQRSLYVSFSRTDSGLCIYHLFVGQTSISCTISSGSPCPPSLSVLICCIRLLCDWLFCFYHHITYHLLWYGGLLWHCFVLLLEEIQFLSAFLATSRFSRVRCCLLVA